ncbi:MAG TPA: flagellar biosynthesis protein [Clostridiaceae bacterium]|nr:flagellar biosynthesis protein [Clostridiaceae bacterium]
MVVNGKYFDYIRKVQEKNNVPVPTSNQPLSNQGKFGEILEEKISQNSEIKFSKHAELRLHMRNINISPVQKQKIAEAVNKASEKGIKDSLVLMDNVALIVNVKNRTVITAVSSNELKDNVFTNIDGAVFA